MIQAYTFHQSVLSLKESQTEIFAFLNKSLCGTQQHQNVNRKIQI